MDGRLDAFARAGTVEAMEAADAWLEEMVQVRRIRNIRNQGHVNPQLSVHPNSYCIKLAKFGLEINFGINQILPSWGSLVDFESGGL